MKAAAFLKFFKFLSFSLPLFRSRLTTIAPYHIIPQLYLIVASRNARFVSQDLRPTEKTFVGKPAIEMDVTMHAVLGHCATQYLAIM